MAAMTTALTEYSTIGDKRTYVTPGSTVQKPKLVVVQRKAPTGNQSVAQYSVSVVHATEDAEGIILQSKVSLGVDCRIPIQGQTADVTAALVILRDYVASDEFTAALSDLSFPA